MKKENLSFGLVRLRVRAGLRLSPILNLSCPLFIATGLSILPAYDLCPLCVSDSTNSSALSSVNSHCVYYLPLAKGFALFLLYSVINMAWERNKQHFWTEIFNRVSEDRNYSTDHYRPRLRVKHKNRYFQVIRTCYCKQKWNKGWLRLHSIFCFIYKMITIAFHHS